MLPPETVKKLTHSLAPARVHKREGSGGQSLDYLATHDVIRYANAIFGFGEWGHDVIELVQIGCDPVTSRNGKPGYKVGYRCTVRLTVNGCVPTSGVGYGDGVDYSGSMIPPHELAMKEAESDAMKRALKNFGDQFGLSLYAKPGVERERVEREARVRFERLGSAEEATPQATPAVSGSAHDTEPASADSAVPTAATGEEPDPGSSPPPLDPRNSPCALFDDKRTTQWKTLKKLDTTIGQGRDNGLFDTATVFSIAREVAPDIVKSDTFYAAHADDAKPHWSQIRMLLPLWACSQMIDKLEAVAEFSRLAS